MNYLIPEAENDYHRRILLVIKATPEVLLYCVSRNDWKAYEQQEVEFREAVRKLDVYILTKKISQTLVEKKFVPVTRLNIRQAEDGIQRIEGYYEINGI